MSYDGEYDASEYPDGIYGPRFGYKGARALAELRTQKDAEIAVLQSVIRKMADRVLGAPAHLDPPLQKMRVDSQIDELGLTVPELGALRKVLSE